MKYSEVYRLLEQHGWRRKEGTRHSKYVHPDFKYPIIVARHEAMEVPTGTLHQIMKQARLKP